MSFASVTYDVVTAIIAADIDRIFPSVMSGENLGALMCCSST